MGEAPYVIIKHRPGQTFKRSIRICRYWKSKATGGTVEIRRVMSDVDRNQIRIAFFDPLIGQELNLPLHKSVHPFQPPGAPEVLMEPGFEELYEPVGNMSSKF